MAQRIGILEKNNHKPLDPYTPEYEPEQRTNR